MLNSDLGNFSTIMLVNEENCIPEHNLLSMYPLIQYICKGKTYLYGPYLPRETP